MNIINTLENIKYWLDLSEYDLKVAKVMLDNKMFLYVGFMCHQSIEKVLKAYFVKSQNLIPPYIHKLVKLAEQSGVYEDMNDVQKDLIDVLEPLNIEARYPTKKEELLSALNIKKCKAILKETEELHSWVKNKLEI